MRARAHISIAIALMVLGPGASAQELEIERETRTVPYFKRPEGPEGWIKQENGFYEAVFQLPPPAYGSYRPDPPADPDSKLKKRKTAQEILENAGVEFGDGASARYDGETGKLYVTNSRAQMEKVADYVAVECLDEYVQRRVLVRTEIYELTKLQALQLLESAASNSDHTPEREAVLKATRKGQAKLVSVASVVTLPGRLAKIDGVGQAPVLIKKHLSGRATPRPKRDERQYGTILEVEPSYYDFENTVHLNIALEYHAADPKSTRNGSAFYPKEILTTVAFHPGEYLILGSWSARDRDSTMVAFVTVGHQLVRP